MTGLCLQTAKCPLPLRWAWPARWLGWVAKWARAELESSEQKAHTCDNACSKQLSLCGMRQRLAFVSYWLVIVVVLFPHHLLGQSVAHDPDSFACRSSHYMLDDFERQPTVPSPDNTKAVQLTKEYKFRITVGKTVLPDFGLPDVSSNVEVGWSPDSSGFFISYSDGGAIGGYHVHLYRVVGNTLKESQAPTTVAKRFKTKHWCESRGNNLFFLDWTPDSKVALFVAEVYPTGDCGKELGVYRGYVVRLQDRKILRTFGEKQTDSMEQKCRASAGLVLPSE